MSEKASLLALWVQRKAQFDQCMELQLFMRDAEQTDNWMAKQEVRIFLSRLYGASFPNPSPQEGRSLGTRLVSMVTVWPHSQTTFVAQVPCHPIKLQKNMMQQAQEREQFSIPTQRDKH